MQKYRTAGMQEYRTVGMQGVGLQVCKISGLKICQSAGLQVCRNAGIRYAKMERRFARVQGCKYSRVENSCMQERRTPGKQEYRTESTSMSMCTLAGTVLYIYCTGAQTEKSD
jgi:hypothetical protein